MSTHFLSAILALFILGVHGRYYGSKREVKVEQLPSGSEDIELFEVDNEGEYDDGTVVAVDFGKSLTAMHVPASDKCYLIGGVDHIISRSSIRQKPEPRLTYTEGDDYTVKDITVLPEPLQERCADKPVKWLERVDHGDGDVPKPRGWCLGVWIIGFCKW